MKTMGKEPRKRRSGTFLVLMVLLVAGAVFVGSAVLAGVTGNPDC